PLLRRNSRAGAPQRDEPSGSYPAGIRSDPHERPNSDMDEVAASTFVRGELEQALHALDDRVALASAAACAQRLFAAYEIFCEAGGTAPASVAAVLSALWDDLAGVRPLSRAELAAMLLTCESRLPTEEEADVPLWAQAEDAIVAVAF